MKRKQRKQKPQARTQEAAGMYGRGWNDDDYDAYYRQYGGYSNHKETRQERTAQLVERGLMFSPTAWLKLLTMCQEANTEIGGYGITREGDPLYIERFETLPQTATASYFEFDEHAIALFQEHEEVEHKTPMDRCNRIWIHTHPGNSATPSYEDEDTLDQNFRDLSWIVMAILAKGGETYARIRHSAGPGSDQVIPMLVDWASMARDTEHFDLLAERLNWLDELKRNVKPRAPRQVAAPVVATPSTATYRRPTYYGQTHQDWVKQGNLWRPPAATQVNQAPVVDPVSSQTTLPAPKPVTKNDDGTVTLSAEAVERLLALVDDYTQLKTELVNARDDLFVARDDLDQATRYILAVQDIKPENVFDPDEDRDLPDVPEELIAAGQFRALDAWRDQERHDRYADGQESDDVEFIGDLR